MKKTSTFQIIILVAFGVFIVIGMAFFSLGGGGGGKDNVKLKGKIAIWGTLPTETVLKTIKEVFPDSSSSISYKQKRKNEFDKDLIEALASGIGPDMILLPQDLILRYSDKIYPIPYKSMSARSFKDRFIEEGELYFTKDGILAIPITINPIVMYWNRDMFSSAGISNVPKYWDEFYKLAQSLTVKDRQSNISRSAISFGEFKNIQHAKDIISMLVIQAGDPITTKNTQTGKGVTSVFSDTFNKSISPAVSAMYFYTEFSNPTKSSYSWNISLPNSFDMFTEGNLAVYFGFADELSKIKKKNPNLNFDVAKVPQVRDSLKDVTFGRMQGLSILKQSKNIDSAFEVSKMLSSPKFISSLSNALGLPPARRDLLAKKPTDAYGALFFDSAVISKAWLDPSPVDTFNIFERMVEDISSGRKMVEGAVLSAGAQIQQLLKNKR